MHRHQRSVNVSQVKSQIKIVILVLMKLHQQEQFKTTFPECFELQILGKKANKLHSKVKCGSAR